MIGWLVIGTNKYLELGVECLESIKEKYTGSQSQKFFLFTDRVDEVKQDWITTFEIEHEVFPYISMSRYRHFVSQKEVLKETDYLYYVDADSLFLSVGDEILGERVTTRHPGWFHRESIDCPFDRNPNSNAFVSYDYKGPYFQNCFQGGYTEEFLKMSEILAERTKMDLGNDVMPLWHDESHMNKYMSENPPTRILDPGYAYPENWRIPFEQKIIGVSKNHDEIRSD